MAFLSLSSFDAQGHDLHMNSLNTRQGTDKKVGKIGISTISIKAILLKVLWSIQRPQEEALPFSRLNDN